MFKDLWQSKGLALSLLKRDISAIYRQSLLGFTWAFIPSIVTALTFTLAADNKILNVGKTDIPYTVYILFGVTLWQTFSESVLGPINSLSAAKGFITKINFPKESLFMAKIGEILFNFLIKCVLLGAILILFKLTPSVGTFAALVVVLITILLGTSIGLLLAPFAMIYQDIIKGIPLILGLGMFLTPSVYPFPTGNSTLATIVRNNPVSYLIMGFRDLTVSGKFNFYPQLLIIAIVAVLFFFFSWLIYRMSLPYIIERCS